MSFALTDTTASGSSASFAVDFPFLHRADVRVFLDGEETHDFTFASDSVITLGSIPASGVVVRRRRFTPIATLIVVAQGKGVVKSADWNLVNTQLLYAIQEALDAANNVEALLIDVEGLLAQALALLALVQAILADLRYSYDVALAAYDLFLASEIVGPVPITKAVTLPVGLTNSQFKVGIAPADGDQILSIRKNNSQIGTLTIAQTTGAITVFFPTETSFAPGDALTLVTTQAGGLLSFGATFAFSRS